MKIVRFLFTFSLTLLLCITLNLRYGQIPPPGKLLDPFGGFWQNAETPQFQTSSLLEFADLNSEVTVFYDSLLVPHIFAQNDHDLYFVQGYLMAYFRLCQMEFQTHFEAGILSEIVGERTLEIDRLNRRLGLVVGAENSMKAYKDFPEVWESITAFSKGVNAYINSLNYHDYPLEYKILDYQPEEWTPLKTGLLLSYMSNTLSGWDNDLQNTNALQIFGRKDFDLLFPEYLMGVDPIVTKEDWGFAPRPVSSHREVSPASDTIRNVLPQPNPENGSNNWVVAGKKSSTGNPLVSNDTHLNLNLPSLWFLIHLNSPNINCMGYTFTGNPGVIVGFNDSSAWGFTNTSWDVKDWYKIEFKDEDKNEYLFDEKWLKTQKRIEKITIRDGETFYDTIVYTHHGPVVYEEGFGDNAKTDYALRWTAHDPSRILKTFHLLNRGSTYDHYVEALRYWDTPAQNIVFGSSSGDIAITVAGNFPLKWKEQGKFLLDGTQSHQDWAGFIPKEHNPFLLNPKQGFLSSANQYPVDPSYPYYNFYGQYGYYRSTRIKQVLDSMEQVSPQDMMRLQMDNYSTKASLILPTMLDSLDRKGLSGYATELLEILSAWDYNFEKDSKAAVIFKIWWNELYKMIWDEFEGKDVALSYPHSFNTIYLLKNHPDSEFFDIKDTPEFESANDLYKLSWLKAVPLIQVVENGLGEDYNWGRYNVLTLRHLSRIDAFGLEVKDMGGINDAVNSIRTERFWGPSQRLITDLGEEVSAWGVYPGGQSGNPGSPYYDNFVDAWARGEYFKLLFIKNPEEIANYSIITQNFKPLD